VTDGPVAVVSGAAAGIGRAVTDALAGRGWRVIALDVDRDALAAIDLPTVRTVVCDVGDADAVATAVGGEPVIDALVNNAAVFNDTRLLAGEYPDRVREHRRAMAAADGSVFLAAACAERLVERHGVIVNLLTEHVHRDHLLTMPSASGYDAAKFALWRFTEHWAAELAPHGVSVYGIAFGATDTPMLRAVSPRTADAGMPASQVAAEVVRLILAGRAGTLASGTVVDLPFTADLVAAARAARQDRPVGGGLSS
jgi:NAD(P)-dependent dehydrogenase (short-subunit alcohol dehydrogenase family)